MDIAVVPVGLQIAGRWLFGPIVCNIFNANDVLFSTASLLHLCCISVDRYVAVTDPFKYQRKMSARRAAAMLTVAWAASVLLSHAPIHLGWYSVEDDPDPGDGVPPSSAWNIVPSTETQS